jgi:nucleoid-associated protein YgaU
LSDTQEKLATTLQGYAAIEKDRDALASRPIPAPAPDQSSRVRELEAQLAAKSPAPAYPDLREQVSNLQIQLDAARALPKQAVSDADFSTLKQELAEAQEKLATTLRGYTLLERERDALAAKTNETTSSQAEVARLTEAYGALQRSTAQNERDLAATKALLQQVQGANTLLAQQNYQLKGDLATSPAPRLTPPALAQPALVVASAPVPASTAPRTHVVVPGDTLVKISQRYYGSATGWQPIYNANRDQLGPNGTLRVGSELRIP